MHEASQQPWPQHQIGRMHYTDPSMLAGQAPPMGYVHHRAATTEILTAAPPHQPSMQSMPAHPMQQEILTENCYSNASEIGIMFVFHYFRVLKNAPKDLHRFYCLDSRVSRVTINADSTVDRKQAYGTAEIADLLNKEHGCPPLVTVAIIQSIECQFTICGGIYIHVSTKIKLLTLGVCVCVFLLLLFCYCLAKWKA